MGLFGLGDPVISMKARDAWIGWNEGTRLENLHHVMDAFVLGAVPPYNFLLGTKLVAMLVASREVQDAFRQKYENSVSRIRGRRFNGELAMVTTTSALGRSSVFNRVRHHHRTLFESVGFTRGSGEFQFTNGVYEAMRQYAHEHCEPSWRAQGWGDGFRSRREVVKKVLPKLGLSLKLSYHEIKREIFVVPLGDNCQQFLLGNHPTLNRFDVTADEHFAWFRERWLLPRAARDLQYRAWNPDEWRLWS
jgi:hypothetical protein